jgi:hypothetical protein
MIRSILSSLALSTSASAAFPVLMNELLPIVENSTYDLDTTRNGRTMVMMDSGRESIFHTLDGLNTTPTMPLRVTRSRGRGLPNIFATPSGSTWMVDLNIGIEFAVLNPPHTNHVLSFDENGILNGALLRAFYLERQNVVSNSSGFFVVPRYSSTIQNIATGQSRSFDPCLDVNGVAIASCTRFPGIAGLGNSIGVLRTLRYRDRGQLQLVKMSVEGQQQQVLNLASVSSQSWASISASSGQLRVVAGVSEQDTLLFNISLTPTAQIQSAGLVSSASSARPLGNGDWLVSNNGLYSQVTPVPFTGELVPIAPNFQFERAASIDGYFDVESNAVGDTLICFLQRNPPFYNHEWRDARGNLLLSRNDLHSAKFEPSGNVVAIATDRSTGIKRMQAIRFNRNGDQVGEAEGFSDIPVLPARIDLFRGPNDTLLAYSGHGRERANLIHQIGTTGSKDRVATLSPLPNATTFYAAGSNWISQAMTDTDQLESVNILTGARYFVPRGGRKIAVGDAIYELSDNAGIAKLRIFRGGQAGNVELPNVASTLVSVKQVNPALANQDELRFVLRNGHNNQQLVMGVANGQAIERFRTGGFVLGDGSLLSATDLNQWTKYNTDGTTVQPYPVCGDLSDAGDDGKGGMWTRKRATEDSPYIICYTSPQGVLSEAITPSYAYGSLSITEDGDWIQLNSVSQTRYRVVDGIVRHYSQMIESLAQTSGLPAINIGDKLYFVATQTNLSEFGLHTYDPAIEQTDLIPASAVIDQYTRSGFE